MQMASSTRMQNEEALFCVHLRRPLGGPSRRGRRWKRPRSRSMLPCVRLRARAGGSAVPGVCGGGTFSWAAEDERLGLGGSWGGPLDARRRNDPRIHLMRPMADAGKRAARGQAGKCRLQPGHPGSAAALCAKFQAGNGRTRFCATW